MAMRLAKPGNTTRALSSRDFAITDANYGVTAAIYECRDCGFRQCTDMTDVTQHYEALEDPAYEQGRAQRLRQARALLEGAIHAAGIDLRGRRLLDVGAGSGVLVEAAAALGLRAEGIEPSSWLASRARERGWPVHVGVLPHPAVHPPFDLITMVDVLEHVADPFALVMAARALLSHDGRLMIVTPDVRSLPARLLGWKWWHYRVAHIGYFDRRTLSRLVARAGLEVESYSRPGWYFPVSYLRERVLRYLPAWMVPRRAAWMERVSLPLNLRDSLCAICKNKTPTAEAL
jgi:SAM-dependent methyltransferase